MQHLHADHPSFGKDPAFMRTASGDVSVALLPLATNVQPIRDHRGAHFALTVAPDDFDAVAAELPERLLSARTGTDHSVAVDVQDYGLQRSMFFEDPDRNIIELTCWPSNAGGAE